MYLLVARSGDIYLHYLLTSTAAGIGDSNRDRDIAVGILDSLHIIIGECGIAESEAEREDGLLLVFFKTTIAHKDVFLIIHLLVNTRIGFLAVFHVRIVLILPCEGNREFSARAYLSCEDIDEGCACFAAEIPTVYEGRHLGEPRGCIRIAAKGNNDDIGIDVCQFADEFVLPE